MVIALWMQMASRAISLDEFMLKINIRRGYLSGYFSIMIVLLRKHQGLKNDTV
jgi:hypothetical protein